MKKIASLLLLITILCMNLTSCIVIQVPNKKEYTKVELNVNNYQDYLSYNAYTKNAKVEEDYSPDGRVFGYCLSWTSVVEFYPTRANCVFENVEISALGDHLPTTLWTINLDGHGYASAQGSVSYNDFHSYIPDKPDYEVRIVRGYVYVYDN